MSNDRVIEAEWLGRPAVQGIFAVLGGGAGKTRAVGGVVRDSLAGVERAGADIDMATELLPVVVMQRAKAAGIAAYPTGIDHGTVTLVLDDTAVEVTTLREDVVTDGRHAQVRFGTDWVADARRRDFTLNALYCDAAGRLFDPLGGVEDLLARRVRFIGDAAERIREDGLRVWRFFRFSASHADQTLDPEGLAACRDAVGQLDHIAAERVGAEMRRLLVLPKVARTLDVMADIGLVALGDGAGLHRYEALGGRDLGARLVLVAGGDLAGLQARWRLSNAEMQQAQEVADAAAMLADDRIAEAAYRHGDAAVEGLAVAAARENWSRPRLAEAAGELARLPQPKLPVGGRDLVEAGLRPGPGIGAALTLIEAAWIDSRFTLDRDSLLRLARPLDGGSEAGSA